MWVQLSEILQLKILEAFWYCRHFDKGTDQERSEELTQMAKKDP
jgi:hypothetical protein